MSDLTMMLRHAKRSNETKLDLSNKYISFIPNEVFSLVSLEILNLSYNKISSIEPKIENLINLKSLDVSENSLMDLPSELLKLTKLQVLNVQGNPLLDKFEKLQTKDGGVGANLNRNLRKCFGLEVEEQTNKPSWLEAETHTSTTKVFDKVIEIENQLKKEQLKNKQLEKELEKLSIHGHSKKSGSLRIDSGSVMEIQFSELRMGEQISQGGFSVIHRGEYKGLEVAIKKVFNPNITEDLLAELGNEVSMLAKFRHPNIILMVGVCSLPPNLCIVMEYMQNGSLYDLLYKQRRELKDDERRKIIRQMVDTVYYLHSHGVVHRDIKPHNFLLGDNLTIKLCDFGLAKNISELNTGAMQFSGTPIYMAPELFLKKGYDNSIDVFALGTMFYELYAKEIPYYGMDPADIRDRVLKDSSLNSLSVKKSVLNLINKCRDKEPSRRPTLRQLREFQDW